MSPLVFKLLPVLLIGLLCSATIGHSITYAQASSLQQCGEHFLKAQQTLQTSSPSHLPGLTTLFDPNAAKRRQLEQAWTECVNGKPIPPLVFTTLTREYYDRASLSGKILVIDFGFMGCASCRAEMPALNRLVREYREKDVLFLGFANDPSAALKPAYFAQHRFDFKIIGGAHPIAQSFFVLAYPTTFIVDKQGIIRDMWMRVNVDPVEPYHRAKAAIDKLLTTFRK